MEERSFPIYNFSEALDNLKSGNDAERRGLRIRLIDNSTFVMLLKRGEHIVKCDWLPSHEDLLANDWRVIKVG